MYAEIETSGIEVQDGLVSVRFAFYLEPFDPRYNEHFVHVIDETSKEFKEGYQGKIDEKGQPVDQKDYDKWLDNLPKVWRNNPFHNHFDLVSADITDAELKVLMKKRLKDFGKAWGESSSILKGWNQNDTHNKTESGYERCAIKALDIAARVNEFKVTVDK